jgi:hypothetical protein
LVPSRAVGFFKESYFHIYVLALIQRQGSYLLESIWEMAYIYRVKPM